MAAVALLAVPAPARADGGAAARGWNWEPSILLGLALAAWIYARGVLAVWDRAGAGRGIARWQVAAFHFGLAALFAALVSPLDAASGSSLAAHMVQHMLLMLVAAPLLALGSPGFAAAWAIPDRWRTRAARWLRPLERWSSRWYLAWQPLLLWWLFGLSLWIWHLPALYQAALRHPGMHALQHLAFVAAACLFWRVLLDPLARARLGRGAGVLYLFTTSLHSMILGVFMALAPTLWYPYYAARSSAWGLTPLEDQQAAGLIMWMPAGMVYAIAAAGLFIAWLRQPEGERPCG